MADNLKDLDRADIERLLGKLNDELRRRNQRAVIYVVGGANIAMAVDDSRTTNDIVVVVKQGFNVVFQAGRAVAKTEAGLGDDWINSAFTDGKPDGGLSWQWMDNRDDDTPTMAFRGDSLTVELASPEMILALKTLAQRDKDMSDIYTLMRMTDVGVKDPQSLGRNLARFTGRRIFDMQRTPGMPLQIDPKFRRVYDNAPDDLRPDDWGPRPSAPSRLRQSVSERRQNRKRERDRRRADREREVALDVLTNPKCGAVSVTTRNGVEIRRTKPCVRPANHRGKHKSGE